MGRADRQARLLLLVVRAGLLACALAMPALAGRLPVRSYTTADGLADDRVHRIVRDSRGFLWFCTMQGLSRFDGYHFTSFGVEHGLPGPAVTSLLEAHDGTYWVATEE